MFETVSPPRSHRLRSAARDLRWMIVVLVVLLGGSVYAASWQSSFAPATLAGLATPGQMKVRLIAAGEPSAELTRAQLALALAMKSSGRWTRVDDEPLAGLDPALDDAQLITLAHALPDFEGAWVLRVTPGPDEHTPATAHIADFGRDARLRHRLTVVEGAPLCGGPADATCTRPAVTDGDDPPLDASEEERLARYRLQRFTPISNGVIGVDIGPERLRLGVDLAKNGVVLDGPREIYAALGRADLVREYDATNEDRRTLGSVSAGLFIGGMSLLSVDLTELEEEDLPIGFESVDSPNELGPVGHWGIGIAGVGLVGVIIALVIDPDPLDEGQRLRLVDAYNSMPGRGPASDRSGSRARPQPGDRSCVGPTGATYTTQFGAAKAARVAARDVAP